MTRSAKRLSNGGGSWLGCWREGKGGGGARPVLRAESLFKSYRVKGNRLETGRVLVAVRDVSVSLYRGRVLAVVGESGCGKSTVARLLACLERLSGGTIWFRGSVVSGRGERARRQYSGRVQMVLQDPFSSLNVAYTVRHHMVRALKLHTPLGRDEVEDRAAALLEEVNLRPGRDLLNRYPHELSGGQRQRVAIARALAVAPEVILADEPVSMLDVSIRLEILRLLEQLTVQRGLALLYITHDIASARYFASETAVMYAAELIEFGPSEIVTQEPAHPYTRLLISATPNPDRVRGANAPRRTWEESRLASLSRRLVVAFTRAALSPWTDADMRRRRPSPSMRAIGPSAGSSTGQMQAGRAVPEAGALLRPTGARSSAMAVTSWRPGQASQLSDDQEGLDLVGPFGPGNRRSGMVHGSIWRQVGRQNQRSARSATGRYRCTVPSRVR